MIDKEKAKTWINQASYADLLNKWRFAHIGDEFFCNEEIFEHYQKVITEKKKSADHVAASKSVGW